MFPCPVGSEWTYSSQHRCYTKKYSVDWTFRSLLSFHFHSTFHGIAMVFLFPIFHFENFLKEKLTHHPDFIIANICFITYFFIYQPILSLTHFKVDCKYSYILPLNTSVCTSLTRTQNLLMSLFKVKFTYNNCNNVKCTIY